MYLSRKPLDFRSINTFVRLYSLGRKNHYDVLNLRRNCTDKEIKEAFIKMSKEYHPDKNKDAKAQEKFVNIVEAYNVLGKPGSRAQYDSLTEVHTGTNTYTSSAAYVYRTHVPHNLRNNPNYSFYYETSNASSQSGSKERTRNEWYYGFEGIKKLPNHYIIGICLSLAFVGVVLQMYVIRNMYAIQRSRAQEKSKHLAEELDKVRAAANENGNELQTRLLLDKIVSAANPTVATASLGRALANEDKEHSDTLLPEFGIGNPTDEWYENEDVKVNLYDIIRKVISYIIM